uniref:hypothetical protein n=1 Tax=Paenibacillus sp. FSL E2-0151 TaxID=2921357 RepID=UPI00259764CF|nr:hypothetical protein [uncultured Paenibacillus sp.]
MRKEDGYENPLFYIHGTLYHQSLFPKIRLVSALWLDFPGRSRTQQALYDYGQNDQPADVAYRLHTCYGMNYRH